MAGWGNPPPPACSRALSPFPISRRCPQSPPDPGCFSSTQSNGEGGSESSVARGHQNSCRIFLFLESFFLSGCAGSSPSVSGLFLVVAHRLPPPQVASCCEHRLQGPWASEGLANSGSGARLCGYVWCTGLKAPCTSGIPWIRDQTCTPCTASPSPLCHQGLSLRGFLMVIKTLPLIEVGKSPRLSSSCGFQDSLASCKVGRASPLLHEESEACRGAGGPTHLVTDLC